MSRETLEQRVTALESRVGGVESTVIQTVHHIHREVIRNQITLAELAARSGIPLACDDAVDDIIADDLREDGRFAEDVIDERS